MAHTSVADPPKAAAHGAPAGQAAKLPARRALKGLAWRMRYVAGGALSVAIAAGAYLYLTTPPAVTDAHLLQQALSDVDAGKAAAARESIARLEAAGYLDPEFPGGVEFIRGIAAFEAAGRGDEASKPAGYLAAAAFLKEAERLTIPEPRKPQWAYALGLCLARGGQVDEAVPLLKEAVEHYPAGKTEAALALVEAHLTGHSSESLKQALELSKAIVATPKLPEALADRAWLQRGEVLLRAGQKGEAEQALGHVSKSPSSGPGKSVLQGQILMADGEFQKALKLLEPIATQKGGDRVVAARAAFLCGVCAIRMGEKMQSQLKPPAGTEPPKLPQPPIKPAADTPASSPETEHRGWLENAVTYLERTAERFPGTPEALAAQVTSADTLRKLGRAEEALETYGTVLRGIHKPETFRNRWVSLKQIQEGILSGWNGWIAERRYAEATALADLMFPVASREQADELFARSHDQWAEHLETELAKLPAEQQPGRRQELRERWRQCGRAWARAAQSRRVANMDAQARSAEFFLKAGEIEQAVGQFTQIVEAAPPHLVTTALLKRGLAYLDLDRTPEALADLRTLITEHPTDANALSAQALIGLCHLEQNEPDLAEAAWRKVLTAKSVDPQSDEWRVAMYELSKLIFQRADAELRATQAARTETGVRERRTAAYAKLDEMIPRLEEYLDRYPDNAESADVRFVVARALQRTAERFEEQQQSAETDDAREEFQRQRLVWLGRAAAQYEPLQARLQERFRKGTLNTWGQLLLRNCCFELAHCRFALGEYPRAVEDYRLCVGRYQQDPDALLALVQMANCYKHMQQPSRVASTLAQAKLMLKQLPDGAFPDKPGAMSRDEWSRWLDWAIGVHQQSKPN